MLSLSNIGFLRRHRVGKRFARAVQPGARLIRGIVRVLRPGLKVRKKIGESGRYLFDGQFLLSDFRSWGTEHNSGFSSMIAEAQGKRCVLDVGAHIGLTALPLADAVGPLGTVIAFEPGTVNFPILLQHVKINKKKNIVCENVLIGNKEIARGKEYFEDLSVSGMNSLFMVDDRKYQGRSDISMRTIDRYCLDHNISPDMLKIDVEGAELLVLEGSLQTLKKCRPTVYISIHPRQLALQEIKPRDVKYFMLRLGYVWYYADGSEIGGEDLEFNEYVARPKTVSAK